MSNFPFNQIIFIKVNTTTNRHWKTKKLNYKTALYAWKNNEKSKRKLKSNIFYRRRSSLLSIDNNKRT